MSGTTVHNGAETLSNGALGCISAPAVLPECLLRVGASFPTLARIYTAHMRANPKEMDEPAMFGLLKSVQESYLCKDKHRPLVCWAPVAFTPCNIIEARFRA